MREVLFAPRSNREVWTEQFVFRDEQSDDGIRLTKADGTSRFVMTAALRPADCLPCIWPAYVSPFYDYPLPGSFSGEQRQATLGSGLTIIDNGALQMVLDLRGLRPGRWRFSLLLDDGDVPIEPVRGFISILPL